MVKPESLRRDVETLAVEIGERHLGRPGSLERTARWIAGELEAAGYAVLPQPYRVDQHTVENVEALLKGVERPDDVLIIGAHYDTVPGSPGADDNGSGVAVLLAIARALAGTRPRCSIRLVAFANEEWPHFHSDSMGSLVYARACSRRGDHIIGMLALESLGYYSNQPGSQQLPDAAMAPEQSAGNFVALVANPASADFLAAITEAFRSASAIPLMPMVLPEDFRGAAYSDHWSFWHEGYPAVMATDTALFRNPTYHEPSDLPDTLCYPELAQVTSALVAVLKQLSGIETV